MEKNMNENISEFESILSVEDSILEQLANKQALLRASVTEKSWEKLTEVISQINAITDSFQELDVKREKIQDSMSLSELKPYFERLGNLRTKLLKCKVENQALGKYVNITKNFIKEVIDNALPQSGNKVYSNKGKILQSQPQSIVVNQLF